MLPIRFHRWRFVRLAAAAVFLAAGLISFACGNPVDKRSAVNVLTIDGTINPVMARYVDRGINNAEDADAVAIVIRIDTPGGLLESMHDIVQDIEDSSIPVITYVSPSGAAAISAGTFITLAGNIAAMAPSTTIGAAHPVGAGGEDIEGTLGDKVTNEEAEYIKGIAALRGRNEDWAESAVRQSIAANQDEALQMNVIDLVSPSLDDLLQQVDGRTVTLSSGEVTLHTAGAPVANNDMTLIERFLFVLSDPNIAFVLISLGMLGLLIELIHPGIFFPGVFGAIALLFGFFSLGTLPFNWAAVLLILLAFALFLAEVFVSGFGALGVGGAIALILGGLLLTSTSDPQFQVSRWLVFGLGIGLGIFFLTIASALIRTRRLPAMLNTYNLVGRKAVVRSRLDPTGLVFIEGELWTATSEEGEIEKGETVETVRVEGIKLIVRPPRKGDNNGSNDD
jgi:membrane-bound serine protease (ClpP class)